MSLNSYKPAKFIQISQLNLGPVANWPSDGTLYAGFPYQYHISLNVSAQAQDNPNYNGGFYDGNSINVGDWIFTTGDGFLVKIVSIASQNPSAVDCIVEDVDQANLYSDSSQTQQGIGEDGPGYLFEVVDGMPVIAPIPLTLGAVLPPYFTSNLLSRFFTDKASTEIEVSQVAHGFSVGQAIYLQTSGAYALASASSPTTANVIGYVTYTDSSPDSFKYRPIGPLVKIAMPSGNPGDLVYLNTSAGGLTTTAPGSNVRELFIRIDSTSGILTGGSASTGSGFQGPQGTSGSNGVQGTAGSNGVQGTAGTNGVQGTAGTNGVQGAAGSDGTTGVQGVQGTTGADGSPGVQGIAGTDGLQGAAGTNGTQGASGVQGLTGAGVQGTTGTQGITGTQGNPGVQGPQASGGLTSYFAQLSGGGGTGPLWVVASGPGVIYSKSSGNFTITIPTGVEITSAKINLQQSDTATLDSVQYALNVIVQYLDGSRNTSTNDVNYPTITFVDESVISLGGTQPTVSTPYQFKALGNSLSCQLIDISTPGGVGQATYRVQQLNFDFFTLVLNF